MKTDKKTQVPIIEGIYLGYPSPENSCTRLDNFKYDDQTKAWHNHFGIEKYFSNAAGMPASPTGRVDSLYVYGRHQGAGQHIIFEQGGQILEVNGSTEAYNVLKTSVKSPVQNQPPAQFCEFGRYIICVTGGRTAPFKYRGGQVMPLGWSFRTSDPSGADPTGTLPLSATSNDYFIQSPADYTAPEAAALTVVKDRDFPCLGSLTATDRNAYSYKVSAVNEAGSESPLSSPTSPVEWTTTSIAKPSGAVTSRTAVLLDNIFTGPPGTVYRKVYRTKRNGTSYYFCNIVTGNRETKYVDYIGDDGLAALAPDATESVPFPAPSAQVCATFKNCLFLDGGRSNPTRIYFSKPLMPDTFGAFDYFDVGTRAGGSITGLFSYYNVLLVFRERAIDIITGDSVNGFQITPFIDTVGTSSPSTISVIPNRGVMFLASDGVYLIGGNFQQLRLEINKVSGPIDEIFERMNKEQLPRAVAAYHSAWKEWQCFFSVGGSPLLNQGIVLHENGSWSTRSSCHVSALAEDCNGNMIIGSDIGLATAASLAAAGNGLFVFSGKRIGGYIGAGNGVPPVEAAPFTSSFRSRWHDFGYPSLKKHVKYIYLYMWTTGNNQMQFSWYRDRDWSTATSNTSPLTYIQRPDHPDQPVYGTALWDTANWQDTFLTQIRVDVGQFGCSDFAFEFTTSAPVQITGYAIELNTSPQETIGAKK